MIGAIDVDWIEIEDALIDCVQVLSDHCGICSTTVTSHQYLRLVCLFLQNQQFHRPGKSRKIIRETECEINHVITIGFAVLLKNLLSTVTKALQRFSCPETIGTCRFNPDLWIQLLGASQVRC